MRDDLDGNIWRANQICRAPRQRHDKSFLGWYGGRRGNYLDCPVFCYPPPGSDWWWMALLCVTGASGHFCLISALNTTYASTIQPFAYLQLVFASTIGILIFDDQLNRELIIGSLMIVGSGLFALGRNRHTKLSAPR